MSQTTGALSNYAYHRLAGLRGPASVEVTIHLPNPFEITPAERELVFTIIDAFTKFETFCRLSGTVNNPSPDSKTEGKG